MKKLILPIILAIISLPAFAEGMFFKPGIVGIDLLQQTLFVGADRDFTGTTTCTSKREFKWKLSDPGIKETYSLLLTAKAMNKNIYVEVDPTLCVNGQITGRWVYIEQ